MNGPRVAIGVPLYNSADHVEEALDALLAQTYCDVGFMLVDDASTDATAAIARRRAEADGRVALVCNARRLGLVCNWRRAYTLAREQFPTARYFAWGSDHDIRDPGWLAPLVAQLDDHEDAVLAHTRNVWLRPDGRRDEPSWSFTTAGVARAGTRFRRACRDLAAGHMVYGLYRIAALERIGAFPLTVGPDRLLLVLLSVHGEFREVRDALWARRATARSSEARQRAAFFPDRRPPLGSRLPLWAQHAGVLAWRLAVQGRGRPHVDRPAGLAYAGYYAGHGLARLGARRARRVGAATANGWRRLVRRRRTSWGHLVKGWRRRIHEMRRRRKALSRRYKRVRRNARRGRMRAGALRDRVRGPH
jgi:glycosyltransferase involved in cell wall biosynthesis